MDLDKHKYPIWYIQHAPMKVEINDVEEILDRAVQKQGRITGLTRFVGREVKILVLDRNLSKKGGATK